ncbi:uncharacterized protein LOC123673121 [Harmonia axyridis]|uniref:uncharacterized protein LOC123673121 n=2 Tax=Harmonia axyridis TaxID=115357 RepID=UPI001E27881F|nr:uncharacterized protein LOC123673121 [Harmonia axyridis]
MENSSSQMLSHYLIIQHSRFQMKVQTQYPNKKIVVSAQLQRQCCLEWQVTSLMLKLCLKAHHHLEQLLLLHLQLLLQPQSVKTNFLRQFLLNHHPKMFQEKKERGAILAICRAVISRHQRSEGKVFTV